MKQPNLIRQVRFLKNVSQDELARELGVSQSVISRLERGVLQNTPLSVEKKKALARVLDYPAAVLFPELGSDDK